MMHLAMVSTNGTVWDISLNENSSPSKLYLLKLPQSCTYHGYSDAKGILNIINGNLKKKLIQYHSSFSKKGHQTIVKNIIIKEKGEHCSPYNWPWQSLSLDDFDTLYICSQCYHQSLQIGNYFWLYGSIYTADQLLHSEVGRKLFQLA